MTHARGQVIAIANTKGGVGKSTLAGNLTWALATQTDRQVYRRVVAQGATVVSEPGPAGVEILALMKDVLDALDTPAQESR